MTCLDIEILSSLAKWLAWVNEYEQYYCYHKTVFLLNKTRVQVQHKGFQTIDFYLLSKNTLKLIYCWSVKQVSSSGGNII